MRHSFHKKLHFTKYAVAALLVTVGAYAAIAMIGDRVSAAEDLVSQEGGIAAPSESTSLVERLRAIKLDRSFVADPAFASLREFIPPDTSTMTSGRSNPFAPLNGGVAPAAR